MLLLLDNYDSFTYNLRQYLEEILQDDVAVYRNDEISLAEAGKYDGFVFSPGPGLPNEAGILIPLIERYHASKPMLGICLGHQAITLAFGGKLKQLDFVLHGLSRKVYMKEPSHGIFEGISTPFEAGRYHSWVPDPTSFPKVLEVLATDEDNEIMVLKHRLFPVYGMQFHPESVLTPCGKKLLSNWLALTGQKQLSLQ
jgi:anthranilate synthase/aminodeoxychorismate synthase-like glutamine amidotransferase